eukprot:XP_019921672.1 PREDICTED: uncharacterized protein LOC105325674 isoform X1 [Crassostrea gigas]
MELGSKYSQTDLLGCFLCSLFYEDPKTLPCLHSFCEKCLVNNFKQQHVNDNLKKCPVCQTFLDVNPQEMKTNIYLQNRVCFFRERAESLTNSVCAVCSLKLQKNVPAVAQCISCSDFLCKVCSDIHTLTTLTINHQVMSLTEIKTGKYDDAMFMASFKACCPKHSDEELKFYCNPCHILTCIDCVVLEHKGHDFKSIDELREEKGNAVKILYEELKAKLGTLNQTKDLIVSRKGQIESKKTGLQSEITKKSSEAASRIDKGKNKMLKDLEDFFLPKSKNLVSGLNSVSIQSKTIRQALQYAEFMLSGSNAEIVFSLDELQESLENCARNDDYKNISACLSDETLDISLKLIEPRLELLFGNVEPFIKETKKEYFPKDENSSDFLCFSDKATQTEEDLKTFDEKRNTGDKKYEIHLIKSLDLTVDDDEYEPHFTGVAWIDDDQFISADIKNEKLKICSLSSGKILRNAKVVAPLAVSVWGEGVACLTRDKTMTNFTRELSPQKTLPNVSCLLSSLPSLNRLTWIENNAIVIQKKGLLTKVSVKYLSPNGQPAWWWFSCCLPDGSYAVSDRANARVYLIDANGNIFKTLQCSPGSISFDKYYNIFISNYYNYSIGVFDIKGTRLTDLYLNDRPTSISILHDKLLVTVEHGCQVLVYDITYKRT